MIVAGIWEARLIFCVTIHLSQQGSSRIHFKDECKKGGKKEPPSVLPGTQHSLNSTDFRKFQLTLLLCLQPLPPVDKSWRKKNSCQELQLSKGCQNLVIIVYGMFIFFVTTERALKQPQRGCCGEHWMLLLGFPHLKCCLWNTDSWLFFRYKEKPSQVRGKKKILKRAPKPFL